MNNEEREAVMANQMPQSQEPQDMIGDGQGMPLDTAVAQGIHTPVNEPKWKKTVRMSMTPSRSSFAEASTSSATSGAADPRSSALGHGSTHIDG